MAAFQIESEYQPAGDQPKAIAQLLEGFRGDRQFQVLLGATGTGKTYSASHVIAALGKPTLVLAHNKTLAAQLYKEFKGFFPHNAVHYFVSYYDYYQPEAYIPQRDIYIEKDSSINENIDRLRLAATSALVSREDVIIVASVSCIYGLGSPSDYKRMMVHLSKGELVERDKLLLKLVDIQYQRNDVAFERGKFRVRGDTIEVWPASEEAGFRIELFGDEVDTLSVIKPVTGEVMKDLDELYIYPAKHFVTPEDRTRGAILGIEAELNDRLAQFKTEGKLLEAERLKARCRYDLDMLREVGYCSGVENYARWFSGRAPGDPPYCLLDFFPEDFLVVVDESHVSFPQVRGMFHGDFARKKTLVEHGFRLPSAMDNRPLKFPEFEQKLKRCLCLSRDAGAVRTRTRRRRSRRAGDPPHRARRSGHPHQASPRPGEGFGKGKPAAFGEERADAGDGAHEAHGRGFDQLLHRERPALQVAAQRTRCHRAGESAARTAAGSVRRARRREPASRRPGPARSEPGGDSGRGQGGLPPQRDFADSDDWPGRPQRERRGDSLRGHGDGQHVAGHRRDQSPAGVASGLQHEHNITPKTVISAIKNLIEDEIAAQDLAMEAAGVSKEEAVTEEFLEELQKEMLAAAENLEFERAALLRDKIAQLKGEKVASPQAKGTRGRKRFSPPGSKKS